MERLNVAIIGCGDIVRAHLEGFRQNKERARVAVCCDRDRAKAESAAEKAEDGTRVETDYDAVLADPEVQAVSLALPHQLHAEYTIKATQAGKHVLCEKPLALTIADCDRMMAAAKQANVVLMHCEPVRMGENINLAAKLAREGAIGKVVGLQACFSYWQRADMNQTWRAHRGDAGGGQLIDGGIHVIDALRNIGGDIETVQAMTQNIRPETGEGEDISVLNLRYASGIFGQFFACHASKWQGASPGISVFGMEGVISTDAGPGRGLVLYLPGKEPEILSEYHSWSRGYERLAENFIDAIQNGAALKSTPEEGRENVRVVLAAYESARTGCAVSVQSIV